MATLKAKLVKGIPTCPQCNYAYDGLIENYGSDGDKGFWFVFLCPVCSVKKKKGKNYSVQIKIKYFCDENFKLIQRRA